MASITRIGVLERGEKNVSLRNLVLVARKLDINASQLLADAGYNNTVHTAAQPGFTGNQGGEEWGSFARRSPAHFGCFDVFPVCAIAKHMASHSRIWRVTVGT